MSQYKPDERLWAFGNFVRSPKRAAGSGLSNLPTRHFYCALCKVAFDRKTKQSKVTHTKTCRCVAEELIGHEGKRKAEELEDASSQAKRNNR
jgi:hypothetical protein